MSAFKVWELQLLKTFNAADFKDLVFEQIILIDSKLINYSIIYFRSIIY